MNTRFRIVPDTNVVLASERSTSPHSPNREVFTRWMNDECQILISDDTLAEYAKKLIEHGFHTERIAEFLTLLEFAAEHIDIQHFHLPVYPSDLDDIAFLLCAVNGEATHLVSYDGHFLSMQNPYLFRICPPISFLQEIRENPTPPPQAS
jgi:predicted nucleic acid-binding protein